jgi:ribonucleoside-diphosphate reductase alpha chain
MLLPLRRRNRRFGSHVLVIPYKLFRRWEVSYMNNHGFLVPRPRETITTGRTERIMTGCGNLYLTINEDKTGLCEIFIHLGKNGGCASSQSEAVGRLVSLLLRAGINPALIIKHLRGIRCHLPAITHGQEVLSCADAIAKLLEKYSISNGQLNQP